MVEIHLSEHCNIFAQFYQLITFLFASQLNQYADSAAAMHIGNQLASLCLFIFLKTSDVQVYDPKNANKPDNIIAKMIEGRLKKELKEFCLVDQPYVKDGDLTVQKYIVSRRNPRRWLHSFGCSSLAISRVSTGCASWSSNRGMGQDERRV